MRRRSNGHVAIFLLSLLLRIPAFLADTSEPEDLGDIVIGIDLGTTYSVVGAYIGGKVEIIPNTLGNRITPSMVAWTDANERLVGDAAKNQASRNPSNTLFDIKRLIGRDFSDPTVKKDKQLFPFELIDHGGKPYVKVDVNGEPQEYAPEFISAMVLTYMKEQAESYLGEKVHRAVITVPAYFNEAQRQATYDAGRAAGLKVERIINEPTAAAIAYGLDKSNNEKNILVYDLGGGTFDVSLLTIDGELFEVLSTSGDTHLGGEDFDNRLTNHFVKEFKKQTGHDVSKNIKAIAKLKAAAEKAKRTLSSAASTRVDVDSLHNGEDFSYSLSRAKFEHLNQDLFKKTLRPIKSVLSDSGLSKSDVHEIVMVGGSTRIPKIQELVRDFFGKELHRGINPDEAVAYGATVMASILSGAAAAEGDTIPTLINVTPLSLGIETVGGVMTNIIEKSSIIPTEKSQVFSTHQDNQESVLISVYQGERKFVNDNVKLGDFHLHGIPPGPRGTPQIEVKFKIDVNGLLSVSATEKSTGKTESIDIEKEAHSLSDDEIQEMIEIAKQFAEQDQEEAGRVQSRNEFESYLYSMKNQISNFDEEGGPEMDEIAKQDVFDAIEEEIEWISINQHADREEYEMRKSDLAEYIEPIIKEYYQGNRPTGGTYYDNDDDEEEYGDDWEHEDL